MRLLSEYSVQLNNFRQSYGYIFATSFIHYLIMQTFFFSLFFVIQRILLHSFADHENNYYSNIKFSGILKTKNVTRGNLLLHIRNAVNTAPIVNYTDTFYAMQSTRECNIMCEHIWSAKVRYHKQQTYIINMFSDTIQAFSEFSDS